MMVKRGGVYEMHVMVKLENRYVQAVITVDSGAEESVMPQSWFDEAEWSPPMEGVKFMGADGSDLGNYGQRLIEFIPAETFTGFTRQA